MAIDSKPVAEVNALERTLIELDVIRWTDWRQWMDKKRREFYPRHYGKLSHKYYIKRRDKYKKND